MLKPRLSTSKKWTQFPKEFSEQIEGVFKENFGANLEKAKLFVEGRIYQEEILLRVGFLEEGRLAQANFEASMQYSPKEQDAVERIHNCIDAVASMIMDYFENPDEADFPRYWKEFPFQGKKIFLQFTTDNVELEAQADALLGENADNLVQEDLASEDALTRAEVEDFERPDDYENEDEPLSDTDEDFESADEESEEDKSGKKMPRMFGNKKKKTPLH